MYLCHFKTTGHPVSCTSTEPLSCRIARLHRQVGCRVLMFYEALTLFQNAVLEHLISVHPNDTPFFLVFFISNIKTCTMMSLRYPSSWTCWTEIDNESFSRKKHTPLQFQGQFLRKLSSFLDRAFGSAALSRPEIVSSAAW